jgi:hypothetical protein
VESNVCHCRQERIPRRHQVRSRQYLGIELQLDGVRALTAHVSGEVFGFHNLDAKNASEETERAKTNLTLRTELSLHIMLDDWSKVREGGRLQT